MGLFNKDDEWKKLTAELARSVWLLQDELRVVRETSDVRGRWLWTLLSKDKDFLENLEKMPEQKREGFKYIFEPTVERGAMMSEWSDEDYQKQRERLWELIQEFITNE